MFEAVLKVAIRDALDTAIRGGGDAVEQLAIVMERDLIALHTDRLAWLSERRGITNTALQLTVEAARTDPTALLDVLELTERLVDADTALRLWKMVQPGAAPAALRAAHAALRKYVEGGHTIEQLSEAGTAIYQLGDAAYRLLSAVDASSPVLEAP